ncbi:InlB B-repeat-containing protein [Bacillus ndiopicus]|uniref:InlB B-repeat-containing protein n=1 Tax=Bacillus ndiopicus TaxID=1347368 RepID=UPI0009DDF91D|nr:InlB B-repeat-containing protein [Bacillus ndiopicus]
MQRKAKRKLAWIAIMVLFMQTLFGNLPAMAIDRDNTISPVVAQMSTTSADSATITQQATTADSAVIYVKQGASGNGTSWTNAFGDLQSALDEASIKLTAGATSVEIWLAQGTYTSTKQIDVTDNRTKTFQMQNNVAIYGGFSGNGTERDWQMYETTLSGDIDVAGNNSDNAYHVFYHPDGLNLNATALLDGVTITGGNANIGNNLHWSGGGMFNENNSPTLTNVIFSSNTARSGGGMYNENSSPTLKNVIFSSNTASSGGGMLNTSSSPTLTDVSFDRNSAPSGGGGMFNFISSPSLTNVTFDRNTADYGGGMFNNSSSPTLTNVTFNRNSAPSWGGGMYNTSSNPTLTGVSFASNSADYGGGMYNTDSSPTLTNGTFSNNTADYGGGMYNINSSIPMLTGVMFASNNSAHYGGGMHNDNHSSPTLTGVSFASNTADYGGGMFNNNYSSPTLTNVMFSSNTASDSLSGGIYNNKSSPSLINITISGNSSAIYGGEANSKIQNSIIVGNDGKRALTNYSGMIENSLLDVDTGGQVLAKFYRSTTDIQPDTYTPEDIFIDPSQQDYQLRAGSPAINTGNNALNTQATDLLGNPRRQGSFIDLGAYESEFAYHAMYERNGAIGDRPVDNMTYKQGDTVTVQNRGNLAKTGFTFAGWNTQADGQGQDYAENASFTMSAQNQTFYAQWTTNPTYTVIYDKNGATGGTVPKDNGVYEENDHVTVQGNSGQLVRTGYTFKGWNTQADGQGQEYAENAYFTMGAQNQIFYAQWTANTYPVTFEANGGSAIVAQQVPYNTQASEPTPPSKQGHTFVGWYKDTALTQEWNFATDIVTAAITLYAKWTTNPTYTVTYDKNGATGGTVPKDNGVYEENDHVTVQGNSGQLVRTGYSFKGWNTQVDGKGTSYAEKAIFPMKKADVTLYAEWRANPPATGGGSNPPPVSNDNDYSPPTKVTITLQTNGGTALKPIEIPYNTKISDIPSPTREGYRFDGWYQDEALTKPLTEETVVRENSTLYAKWTALPVEEPKQPQEPQSAKPNVIFRDVEKHWAKAMIEELATLGIIQGYEDGSFRPNSPISRMHVAVLLTRAFPLETVRNADDFSDVPKNHRYYEAIKTLQQAGIVDGSNGAFHPTENMTRAQLAKVLVGVLGLTPEGTSSFKDVASKHWSAGYIAALEREGIALGDNGNFRPNEPVTRAQFVAFLYRIMQK